MSDRIIKVVETPDELKLYQELIFQVYCQELKWFKPENFPNGRVEDELDAQSMHFLIISQSKEIMAGMRLIRSKPLALPIFSKFGQKRPPEEIFQSHDCQPSLKYEMEISQVAALKKFRDQRRGFVFDTGKIFYQYCRQNSVNYMYFTVDLRVFLELHKNNLWVDPIGLPKFYFGSWVLPCISLFSKWVENIKRNNSQAFDYFVDYGNLIGSFEDSDLQNG